jgi:hypothetical protein
MRLPNRTESPTTESTPAARTLCRGRRIEREEN